MAINLKVGDKTTVVKDEETKQAAIADLAAQNAELQKQIDAFKAEKAAAAAAAQPKPAEFSISCAAYSMTFAGTKDALRGQLKGTMKIKLPIAGHYGLELGVAEFRSLLEHKDEILTFIGENHNKLAEAVANVDRIKSKKAK